MAGYFGAAVGGALQGYNDAMQQRQVAIARAQQMQDEALRQQILRQQLVDQSQAESALPQILAGMGQPSYYGTGQAPPAQNTPAPGQPSVPMQQPSASTGAGSVTPVGPNQIAPYENMATHVARNAAAQQPFSPLAVYRRIASMPGLSGGAKSLLIKQISPLMTAQSNEEMKMMQYQSNLMLRLQGLQYQQQRLKQAAQSQKDTNEWHQADLDLKREIAATNVALKRATIAAGGRPPTGYQWSKTEKGRLEPIPGGPYDVSGFSDAFDLAAKQYLAGDRSAVQGFSRNAQMRAAMAAAIEKEAKAQGMGGKQIAAKLAEFQGTLAGERTAGQRIATVETAANEARQMAPLVLQSSNAVNRTNYPALNSILLAGMRGTGDTNVVRFGAALNSFINAYSRAVSPTGAATVADKEHAREILSANWSKGQIQAGLQQLELEMQAAESAPQATRQALTKTITGSAPTSGTVMRFDAQGNLIK